MLLGMKVGLSTGDFVLHGDPVLLPPKGRSPPIFGPRLLWPNGCMDQDAAWYGGRSRPTRHCVRWGPSSPSPKGAQLTQFSAIVHCGQTAGWTKMPLGVEVGLSPFDFVFDGYPANSGKRAHTPHPIFGPCLLWPNGWMKTPLGTEVDLGRGHIVLDVVPAVRKRGTTAHPPLFAHVY